MENIRDKFILFINKHPNIIKYVDVIETINNKLLIGSIAVIIAIISLSIGVVYIKMPVDIRTEIASLFGIVLTAIIVPIYLKMIDKKYLLKQELLKNNKELYLELSSVLVSLTTIGDRKANIKIYDDFFKENYSKMCVYFSSKLLLSVILVGKEYQKGHDENVKYYSEKSIRLIRKEIGVDSNFMYADLGFVNNSKE